jgi:colanic acid/amylovoran biosynthesis glycosyltransferase
MKRQTMKVAYLCCLYPGVSHTFVLREVEALRRRGAEIDTFTIRRAKTDQLLADADRAAFQNTFAILPPQWIRLLGAHLRLAITAPKTYLRTLALALRLAPPGLRERLWQFFYFVESVLMWSECRRRGIRHIHVHLANVATDVALLATEIGSAVDGPGRWSWSFSMHGPTELFDVGRYNLAEKIARARFVICISDFTRSQLMSLCGPELWGKLHVIHVGIPLDQFTRTNAYANGSRPADPTILFIGRQVPEKGQGVLLEAVASLSKRGHTVKVTLAGDGVARMSLEQLAKRLGLASQVSFPGAVGQDHICALYEQASIFCLPSFAEGVPGVLMEAMAMELPVVTTRITGIPELVDDGQTGLLVTPGRADLLADALERLIVDPKLCRRMGLAAREKVRREFNTESSADQLSARFSTELFGAPATSNGSILAQDGQIVTPLQDDSVAIHDGSAGGREEPVHDERVST